MQWKPMAKPMAKRFGKAGGDIRLVSQVSLVRLFLYATIMPSLYVLETMHLSPSRIDSVYAPLDLET